MTKKRRPNAAVAATETNLKRQRRGEVSFLLFSDGRADPEEWRPNADESMWWGRRDALCRISAAALWPGGEAVGGAVSELTVLLSDDLSLLRMDVRLKEAFPGGGTEQDFVRAWRRAIAGTGAKGVVCIKEAWQQKHLQGCPEELGRREMLEHLQRKMDLEFLRKHGLNKNLDRLLKSMSKRQVLDVWTAGRLGAAETRVDDVEPSVTSTSTSTCGKRNVSPELLETVKAELSRLPENSVVAILHEDCHAELKLFDFQRLTESTDPTVESRFTAVLFVLGAVRDMTTQELAAISLAAKALKLKLVRLRLGSTPEFSSKVVRCLAAAQLRDLVLPAVQQALTSKQPEACSGATIDFTVLYAIDVDASAVHADKPRRVLLQLLQLCVCTLWRSKIGDALTSEGNVESSSRFVEPHLRLLFRDGTTLSLGTSFVEGMSRCHKAAPTERQILEALQQRLETRKPGHWQKRLRSLLERANASSAAPALLLSHEGYDPFAAAATGICPPDETARVMHLRPHCRMR